MLPGNGKTGKGATVVAIYGFFPLLMFGFWLYCVLDAALSEAALVRNLPKITWVFITLLFPLVGGIAWLVAGRPERAGFSPGSTRTRSHGPGRNASTRGNPVRRPPPKGPDDNPSFLRSLDERLKDERDPGAETGP